MRLLCKTVTQSIIHNLQFTTSNSEENASILRGVNSHPVNKQTSLINLLENKDSAENSKSYRIDSIYSTNLLYVDISFKYHRRNGTLQIS